MKTRNCIHVVFLKDKESSTICKYCGKAIVKTKSPKGYIEYECSCDKWNKAMQINEKLQEMNRILRETFQDYERKFINIKHKAIKDGYEITENIYNLVKDK